MSSFQMMSELADNYRRVNIVSRENRHLREQAFILAVEKLFAEESHLQQLTQLRELADGFLFAQLAVEEKLSDTEKEIHLLKQQLSASQDSLTARFESERLAEDAREKAEHES